MLILGCGRPWPPRSPKPRSPNCWKNLSRGLPLGKFGIGIGCCESPSNDTFDWSILTLTETTAPLTRSTMSANDAGPADGVLVAAKAGWLATGSASIVRPPTAATATALSKAVRNDFRAVNCERLLVTL